MVEVDIFCKVYNWLRVNNLDYGCMPERTECPTPIIFEDKPGVNNTDEEKDPKWKTLGMSVFLSKSWRAHPFYSYL